MSFLLYKYHPPFPLFIPVWKKSIYQCLYRFTSSTLSLDLWYDYRYYYDLFFHKVSVSLCSRIITPEFKSSHNEIAVISRIDNYLRVIIWRIKNTKFCYDFNKIHFRKNWIKQLKSSLKKLNQQVKYSPVTLV